MTLPATDAFTNSDGTALPTHDASWTEQSGSFAINTNSVYSDTSATACAYWNADTFDDDQYSQAVVAEMSSGTSGRMGVACRASGTNNNYHLWARNFGATTRTLAKRVSGTITTLASDGTAISVSDVFRIEAEGTTIRGIVNSSTVFSVTDSALTSGSAGLFSDNNSLTTKRFDDWEGGDIGGGGGGRVSALMLLGVS